MSKSNHTKKESKEYSTPSLLEPESCGGDTAEGGFSFQDGVILSKIPEWLAHEGFASFIRESIGDVESRWFEPACGEVIDVIEAKNHHITPVPFWEEIDRFQKMVSSDQYRRFTLACTSISDELSVISHATRRVRDPVPFYGGNSTVVTNSIDDFVKLIESKGTSKTDAKFLLERVDIDAGWTSSRDFAEAMFRQAAEKWIPGFSDLSSGKVGWVFRRLISLVRGRLNRPVTRKQLESAICEVVEDDGFFANHRIRVETTTSSFPGTETALRFQWDDFFGGTDRSYLSTIDWQTRIVEQLAATRKWIAEHRSQRRVILGGERRLSTTLAVGSQFSAVAGFNIDLEYRGAIWSTDAHPQAADTYELSRTDERGSGDELVLIVDILRDIGEPVAAACKKLGLGQCPRTRLHGATALTSDRQANDIVCSIKQLFDHRLLETGAKKIHLFLACPSPVALFLGHRLNATAEVQCYEWIGGSSYVPTCCLHT